MTDDIIVKASGSAPMRVTREVVAQNRKRILETATRLSKTQGIDTVSVADLMKAAGFTHGGFYNHFESKADLVIEMVKYAFEQTLSEICGDGVERAGNASSMEERLASYLSP